MKAIHQRLARLIHELSLRTRLEGEEPFRLSSGITSRHFVDLDYAMCDATGMRLVVDCVAEEMPRHVLDAIGGPHSGADRIATGVALRSGPTMIRASPWLHTFSVPKCPAALEVKGWARPGASVVLVDDVLTTGGSLIRAYQACQAAGMVVKKAVVVVDREEGGMERVRKLLGSAVPVVALLTLSDVIHAEPLRNLVASG